MPSHIKSSSSGFIGILQKKPMRFFKITDFDGALAKSFMIMAFGFSGGVGWAAEYVDSGYRQISGGRWDVVGDLVVGYSNVGYLVVDNQAQVTSENGYLGYAPLSMGQVVLTGNSTSWTNTGFLGIGIDGNAVLWIEDGATVISSDTLIAGSGGSTSQLNLNGTSLARGKLSTGYLMKGAGTALFQWDGGILQARNNEADFFLNFSRYEIEIGNEGAFFDTNGYDVGISTDLIATGSGGFTKIGSGSLTLSGNNDYSGGTFISGGTLVANNNSALGSGAVTVGGAGTTGTLKVNAGITLANSVTLNNGGTLSGFGAVGNTVVESGGVISPGQSGSIGTLTVNGNLDMKTGAVYHVQAAPNSSVSSLINVTGIATLAGNVLHVGNESNASTDFQVGKTYTILHASQINGVFNGASSNYAYLDATLGYLQTNSVTTDVTLQLQRKTSNTGGGNMGFAELAETRNQSSVANAINSLPSSSALYQFVETLPAGTPVTVLASLSGDAQASVGSSLVGLGAYAPSVSSQHLRNNMTAGFRAGAPVAQSDGQLPASAWPSSKALPAWAEVVGHWQRYDSDGNAAQLKQRTTGLFLGMDQEVGISGWRLGGSLGYTNASGKVADRSSESDVNSYSAAVYGGKSFGSGTGPRINVLGGLAYTWHDIETTRRVTSLGQTLKADYSAHTAQLFAEVGYAIGQYDKLGFEPFAGVSLGQQRTGSFQEHGGFAALKGRSSTDDLASTTLGLRVHSDFQLAGKEGRLRATVGWRHAFGDVTAKKTMAFEGGQNFTVAGTPLARNTAVLGLEADVALSRSAALVLGYQGEMGSGQRDHSASVKLRWAF
ncbi:autotransporter domain-containing protein [Comamonas terrigena]|uniref:autotransporter family protein n=1 Tax=Comamonas terrigena TaxID=32013 RepID=UPI00244A4BC4|nr:autotransporter domain-containing protein [Comamonas terrigena]MDH1700256.1 autotransporter domain-containing protein [Comamonas terrigena]